jgi:hypothetical protein
MIVWLSSSLAWAQQPPPAAKPAPATKPAAPAAAAPGPKPAASAAAAPGVPTAPMVPPKPSPELEQLKALAGNWKCDGHQNESPMGPAEDFKASFANKWDLGNFWLASTYDEKHKKMSFTGKGWFGYNPVAKQYVFGGVDSWGGHIALRSTGWEGDKLTLNGEGIGPSGQMKMGFIFEKKGKDLLFTFQTQDPKGQWVPVSTETCKKSGA